MIILAEIGSSSLPWPMNHFLTVSGTLAQPKLRKTSISLGFCLIVSSLKAKRCYWTIANGFSILADLFAES